MQQKWKNLCLSTEHPALLIPHRWGTNLSGTHASPSLVGFGSHRGTSQSFKDQRSKSAHCMRLWLMSIAERNTEEKLVITKVDLRNLEPQTQVVYRYTQQQCQNWELQEALDYSRCFMIQTISLSIKWYTFLLPANALRSWKFEGNLSVRTGLRPKATPHWEGSLHFWNPQELRRVEHNFRNNSFLDRLSVLRCAKCLDPKNPSGWRSLWESVLHPNQRQAGRPGKMEVTSQTHGQTLSMRDRLEENHYGKPSPFMQLWSYTKISDVTTWDEEIWPYNRKWDCF